MTAGPDISVPELAVDHLVYAAPSLDAGIDGIRERMGVDPVPGGRHPRWRTRNALVGLGPTTYLEIIGPDGGRDDGSDEGGETRPFGIDGLQAPRLATWAARTSSLEAAVRAIRSLAVDPGAVMEGSREAPDGSVLRWRLTDPTADRDGGTLPFLIDWGRSTHPAASLEHPCRLRELRIRHPEPGRIRPFVHSLHPRVVLEPGPGPALSASLDTPAGTVDLHQEGVG